MRRVVWICASLSIAVHAVAVNMLPPLDPPARAIKPKPVTTSFWRTRHADQPTSINVPPPDAEPIDVAIPTDASGTPLVSDPAVNTGEEPRISTSISLADEPEPDVIASAASMPEAQASAPQVTTASTQGMDSEYIPRPQLNVPPIPTEPVLIAPPKGDYPAERLSGILSLYIGEDGRVHHIVSSGAPLPAEFDQAAKDAFRAIVFKPGILDGTTVKSRIRVEIVFDNTPLPELPKAKH